ADTLSVDARTPAGLCAPMLADALRVIGPVPRSVLITAQFAADRAGRTGGLEPPVDRRL
ncbi:pyrroline-5-carboxylate reductase, partial [Xanthomonas oryzae pv. oryzae]